MTEAASRTGDPETRAAASNSGGSARKVVVAVHGVGDQFENSTIQFVAHRFCAHYRVPAAISLGRFRLLDDVGQPRPLVRLEDLMPPFQDDDAKLAFAEFYWADVCRDAITKGYTIEQTKRWASTIADNVCSTCQDSGHVHLDTREQQTLRTVLMEMVDAIGVLDRICWIGKASGAFTFDLKAVLDGFVNDVQIVAEFETHRRNILARFDEQMQRVADAASRDEDESHPAEIYIVAHSEGSVVTFLALLEAFGKPRGANHWAHRVRGFMTIGSPIDKHLILWPRIFKDSPPAWTPAKPIRWKNFYDWGDPIGFKLDSARLWMWAHGWIVEKTGRSVFEFDAERDDYGFARYPLPGKAHIDYWADDGVFGNFIEQVILRPDGDEHSTGKAPPPRYNDPPKTRFWCSAVARVVPYLLVLAICYVAAYLMYKAGTESLPKENASAGTSAVTTPSHPARISPALERANTNTATPFLSTFRRIGSTALLLFAIIVFARTCVVSRCGWCWCLGVAVYVACAALYAYAAPGESGFPATRQGARIVALAGAVIALLALGINRKKPLWGVRPLVVLMGVALAVVIVFWTRSAPNGTKLWPVLMASGAFLYGMWLAILIYDLAFIWHRYIRSGAALDRLRPGFAHAMAKVNPRACAMANSVNARRE